MNAHNEQHESEPSVVKQNLTTQPAAAQEAVAFRLLYKTHSGEWSEQGLPWTGGKPGPKLIAEAALPGSRWKIEWAYAAPVTAAPAELIERCKEILAWQRTGVLPGDALRAYANARWPDEHDPLQIAEKETAREAFRILAKAAAASTPAAPGIDLFDIHSLIAELETEAMSAATSDNVLCQKSAAIKQRIVERLRTLLAARPQGVKDAT